MGSDVERWDGLALRELWKSGPMSARQIMEAVPIQQFEAETATAWVDSALVRGLIEGTGGSGASARFNITDAGRAAIDIPTGR